MDYGKIDPYPGWTPESKICPKCKGELEDLRGIGLNILKFRQEVGKCFLFGGDRPALECSRPRTA